MQPSQKNIDMNRNLWTANHLVYRIHAVLTLQAGLLTSFNAHALFPVSQ